MEFVAMVADINKVFADVHAGLVSRNEATHDLLRISSRSAWASAELDMTEQVEIQDLIESIMREWGTL